MKICGEEIVNMKKLIVFLFILSAVFLFAWPKTDVDAIGGTVNVSVRSIFDAENTVTNNLNAQTYGTSVSLDAQLGSQSGYSFAFWAVNGVYRPDLALATSQFVVTSDMSIDAYFSSDTQHLVTFIDSNYRVLKAEHVSNNGTATAPGTLPTKPGLVVAGTPWKELGGVKTTLDSITEDIIFVLQYIEEDTDTLEINVYDYDLSTYVNDSIVDYNHIAEVSTPLEVSGQYFQYWEEDGKKVSYEANYKFTALSDRNLKAIYAGTAPTEPARMVYLSNDLNRRDGYRTYIGQFDVDTPYTLVEYGFLIAETSEANLSTGTSGVVIAQSYQYNPATNEFVMSFPINSHLSVRAYIVVDNEGSISTLYSDLNITYTPVQLSTPSNFSINSTTEVVTWDAVANADSYKVYIGNQTFDVETNSINLRSQSINRNTNYEVAVKAISEGVYYTNSSMTTEQSYYHGFHDLIISEYIEGSSNNKYIEIYNGTGETVDLSIYEFRNYSNGSSSPNSITLSGTLNHNEVKVYKNSSAVLTLPVGVTAVNLGNVTFNGDDAIALYNKNTSSFVDIFGRIGNDPGTAWTADGGYSTLDKTLVRKSTVYIGVLVSPTETGATAFTTLATEWDLSNIDTVSNLGSHSVNSAATETIPE